MHALSALSLRLAVWLQLAGHSVTNRSRLERGQGMVEYGLILALIAIAAVAVLVLLGPQVSGMFKDSLTAVSGARATPTP